MIIIIILLFIFLFFFRLVMKLCLSVLRSSTEIQRSHNKKTGKYSFDRKVEQDCLLSWLTRTYDLGSTPFYHLIRVTHNT